MASIPFVDFPRLHAPLRGELHAAALGLIDSGKFIGGEPVRAFERELAAAHGMADAVGVACATSGLYSVLKCLGIGPGDEVIVPAHTAICTAEAVTLCGATAVFADIAEGYFHMDPAEVRRRLTARTRALLPVHLYGQPCDLQPLLALAREKGLHLVEDCAQAQGAAIGGRRVGTMGDAAVYSFFPSKNLGGFGDGGAVLAHDATLLRKVRMFSNHGRESKYDHEFEGINSRLDALQAALLRVCLPRLDGWNAHRRQAAAWYREELQGVAQLELPRELPGTEPVYHVFVVLAPDREALAAHLKAAGVETGVHYPRALNLLKAYEARGQGRGSYPRAEYACDHCLSLPMHPAITRAEVQAVAQAVRAFFRA